MRDLEKQVQELTAKCGDRVVPAVEQTAAAA
jgi:hypothetical protein